MLPDKPNSYATMISPRLSSSPTPNGYFTGPNTPLQPKNSSSSSFVGPTPLQADQHQSYTLNGTDQSPDCSSPVLTEQISKFPSQCVEKNLQGIWPSFISNTCSIVRPLQLQYSILFSGNISSSVPSVSHVSTSPETTPHAPYIKMHGRLHHNFDPNEVPYNWACDTAECSCQALMHLTLKTTLGSNAVANFTEAPKRVLDLGTGIGLWILDMAKEWPETEFVGTDIIPNFPHESLYADLQTSSKTNRISFMVHNFLHGLPFPDEYFDYVHMRNCGSGIPEPNFGDLVDEMVRVTKIGGAIEIIDADIVISLPSDRELSPEARRVTESINEWNRTSLLKRMISPYPTSLWPALMLNLKNLKRIEVNYPFSGMGWSSITEPTRIQNLMKEAGLGSRSANQQQSATALDPKNMSDVEGDDVQMAEQGMLPGTKVYKSSLSNCALHATRNFISGIKDELWEASGLEEPEYDQRLSTYIRECERGKNGEYMNICIFTGARPAE